MTKRISAVVFVACFLAAMPHFAGAHGGGLNSEGCHNETATGGYHCHRGDSDSDVNWETIGIVAGGLLVLGLVFSGFGRGFRTLEAIPERGLRFTPTRGNQVGAFWELRF